jgi:hypothetical protein
MEGSLTLHWVLDDAKRWFWCDAAVTTDEGQASWIGSTGTTGNVNVALYEGFRLLRSCVAAPEFEHRG